MIDTRAAHRGEEVALLVVTRRYHAVERTAERYVLLQIRYGLLQDIDIGLGRIYLLLGNPSRLIYGLHPCKIQFGIGKLEGIGVVLRLVHFGEYLALLDLVADIHVQLLDTGRYRRNDIRLFVRLQIGREIHGLGHLLLVGLLYLHRDGFVAPAGHSLVLTLAAGKSHYRHNRRCD